MNRILLFIFSFIFFSCGQKPQESKAVNPVDKVEQKQISFEEVQTISTPKILFPGTYRDPAQEELSQLNSSWHELFYDKKENVWKIAATDYKIARGFDECIGDSTTILSSTRNPLIIFTGISVNVGSLNSIKPEQDVIPPNRSIKFSFNGNNYRISAMGNVIDQSGYIMPSNEIAQLQTQDFDNYKIETYMLSLSDEDGKSQLLFNIPKLGNGLTKLVWIGDLDNDGRPDFVFDTSSDPEVEIKELYLSSGTNSSDFVKKVAYITIGFDC
ncbi:MAG TPA: hypothetical protein VLZ83_03340 [Edaphocola sp.]|nr:hypothetical protein [Edaphocola sp.]